MSVEENKALVSELVEGVLNGGDLDLIDEIVSPDFVENEVLPPGIPPGREAPKMMFRMLHSAFPDFNAEIQHLIAEGDKVVLHMLWTGTQDGEFMGIPPTGRSISISVIDILRIKDGMFVEHWGIMDAAAMMQQLGVAP